METPRRELLSRLYHAALECPPGERSAFLKDACAGDAALQRELESLLRHEPAAARFLDIPAAQIVANAHKLDPEMVGRQLGPYKIAALLGAGGMGEVYRARDRKLDRDVAIKILPSHFTADPERRSRFAREARVLATLNHPHIAAIYGLEEIGAVTGLVLELVEGPTLAHHLERGALSRSEAIAIALQIADALHAAHEKGIVHRDLKPANIMLQGISGPSLATLCVKVLDFGLAKAAAGGLDGDLATAPAGSPVGTVEGRILGTPAYMSPEQARGPAVDKRTDIWAFGCILFEMLTGRRAFSGDTVTETLAAVLRGDLDWKGLPPDTPVSVRRLLRRCLDNDPTRRLQHIGDARLELDQTAFERLVADISARFVNAEPAQVDAEITGALRSLVEFLAIDRSNLFQWSTDGRNLQNTHQWVVEGCEPLPPIFVQEALPFFLPKLLQGEPYGYASLAELPPEAATERVFLERHGPKSKLCLPLVVGGTVVGALGLGVLRHECEWPDALKERLAVVAHVFANALERKRSDLALQQAHTELTQLKERLELENQFLRQQLKMVRKTSRASRRAPR